MNVKKILKYIKEYINNNKIEIITICVLFIFGILVCSSKRVFSTDESLSFALANKIGGWVTYDSNQWLDVDTFANYGVTSNPFNYSMVYSNQVYDVHPPLYYYILHTISSCFVNRFSVWFGLIINLFSYAINLFLIFRIIKKETNNNIISSLGLVLYAVNANTIFSLTYIRMYQLVSTFVLLFVYFGLRIINNKEGNVLNYFFLSLTVLLGGLTHYYYYVAIFLICLFFLFKLLNIRDYKKIIVSSVVVVSTVLFDILILFPPTLQHCFGIGGDISRHGSKILNNVINTSFDINKVFKGLENSWGKTAITLMVFICLIFYVFVSKIKKRRINENIYILFSSLLFLAFMCILSDNASKFYLTIMEPLTIAFVVVLLFDMFRKKSIIPIVVLMIFTNNFNYIANNIYTRKSWDFAKENKNKYALVINIKDLDESLTNTSFNDFRWYKQVGVIEEDNKDVFFNIKEDYILYIDKTLNQEEALDLVTRSNNSVHDCKEEDIKTNLYNVYSCKFVSDLSEN